VFDAFEICTVTRVECSCTPCVNLKAIGAQVSEQCVHKHLKPFHFYRYRLQLV
jgi:hypothetical protein